MMPRKYTIGVTIREIMPAVAACMKAPIIDITPKIAPSTIPAPKRNFISLVVMKSEKEKSNNDPKNVFAPSFTSVAVTFAMPRLLIFY